MNKLTFKELPKSPVETLKQCGIVTSLQDLITERYYHFDFDVFLKTKGFNLQRDYCWTDQQAAEFIMSVLLEKPIPPVYFNLRIDDDIAECIDGKQRILSLVRFYNNQFPITVNGQQYKFCDMEENMQIRLKLYYIDGYMHHQRNNDPSSILSDDDKINWFLFINTSGVPQNSTHINHLRECLVQSNS